MERQLSYFSMMEDTLEWKILPSDGPDGYDYRFPTLLIAHSFRKQEYDVYITDLRNFWCERMDRRAINKRALLTDTSIDPTEDDEQMKLLLDKIKDGLEGERSADVELILGDSRGLDTNDDEDGNVPQMAINLTVNLPKPFKPLHWKLELKPCDSSFLLSYITAPLIIAENEAREQISDLLRVIREKDHVIQKLADKLEASGTELGQVFPSAAGKGGRKLTRKTVEERVAGLSTFKYESWLKNFRLGEESNETAGASEYYGEMILRCFSSGVELPKSGHYDWNQTYERWWKPLEGETISLSKSWMSDQDENDGKKKQRDNPIEKQAIFEDSHEAIIEKDIFDKVQIIRQQRQRKTKSGCTSTFSGLVYCADCGEKLYYGATNNGKREGAFFDCSLHWKHKDKCGTHFIRESVLERMVLKHIQLVMGYILRYRQHFIFVMEQQLQLESAEKLQTSRKQLERNERRIAELKRLFIKIYEDNAKGNLSDERYEMMSQNYEAEQKQLEAEVVALRQEIEVQERQNENIERFIRTADKYVDIEEIDPCMLRELIKAIYVEAPDKSSGKRRQKIHIEYDGIGFIPLEELAKKETA